MAVRRSLPESHNPLLEPEHTPPLEILVERRRLGQTDLTAKPGQVGVTNAAKSENLGIFDYAHLRVPLPQDLKGSGIFSQQQKNKYPESYFLMRRSSDGYISATGMFKAAFPWASSDDEQTERKYHKTLPSAGPEEVAGNVWISPPEALKLAEEYRMRPWIIALLDPETIEKGTKDKDKNEIQAPPKYVLSDMDKMFPPPTSSTRRTRELRSASPTKLARKIATPRKSRRTAKAASVDSDIAPTKPAPASSLRKLENGVASSEKEPTPSGASTQEQPEEVVRVEVDETVERENDVETTHTTVKVEMPAHHPDLPLPETTEEMIAKAKEMVQEANRLEENRARTNQKRKAGEVESEDKDEEAGPSEPVTKKQRVALTETLKKERVKGRALVAILAAVGLGAIIPSFL